MGLIRPVIVIHGSGDKTTYIIIGYRKKKNGIRKLKTYSVESVLKCQTHKISVVFDTHHHCYDDQKIISYYILHTSYIKKKNIKPNFTYLTRFIDVYQVI